jgi:hypothetical protein
MSIISDTEYVLYHLQCSVLTTPHSYLIHSIRLAYLKEVDDIYGPRVVAFDPSYSANPYITHASLADSERWPELSAPTSPQISEDEAERPAGFPAAKLRYTQTIMAGRSGGLGLRVTGKRASTSRRISKSNIPIPKVDVQYASPPSAQDDPQQPNPLLDSSPSQSEAKADGTSSAEETQVPKVVQFIPKFKGAAEMERRRRARMAARRAPNGPLGPPQPAHRVLSFSSSEDEAQPQSSDESSSDSDFGSGGNAHGVDGVDDFDP